MSKCCWFEWLNKDQIIDIHHIIRFLKNKQALLTLREHLTSPPICVAHRISLLLCFFFFVQYRLSNVVFFLLRPVSFVQCCVLSSSSSIVCPMLPMSLGVNSSVFSNIYWFALTNVYDGLITIPKTICLVQKGCHNCQQRNKTYT